MAEFIVKEHVIEAQHIRGFPGATADSQEEVLYLAVKQYTPRNNPDPQPGDITIIGAHANGFPKELYEPLWDDLVRSLSQRGIKVRGIWIADVAWQGQSGIINEGKLGDDPSWSDHARDLLYLTNHFRASMPRPLIGIGHSFGATIIANLSLLHPRLLSSLILIDPVIMYFPSPGESQSHPQKENDNKGADPEAGLAPLRAALARRDLWPTRDAAIASFRRNPFYSAWDPRVFDAWTTHGLRDTPTALYPEPGSVTLTTTKDMEATTYIRPILSPTPSSYRPEIPHTFARLPDLLPATLYIHGGDSKTNPARVRDANVARTGVGEFGSSGGGGDDDGTGKGKGTKVKGVVVDGCGHLVPFEAPGRCAEEVARFLAGVEGGLVGEKGVKGKL